MTRTAKNAQNQVNTSVAVIANFGKSTTKRLISNEIPKVTHISRRWSKGIWNHVSPAVMIVLRYSERLEQRLIDRGLLRSNLQTFSNWDRSDLGPVYPLIIAILIGVTVLIYGLVTDNISSNEAPLINHISNKSVAEGELLQFTISASDPNNDTLSYSASNLPSGATFDTETGTFSWTPTYAQAGIHANIHFEISDNKLTASDDITITVNKPYHDSDVNRDGDIDILDMIIVMQRQGEAGPAGWIPEDVNEDGAVNISDVIPIGQQ